MIVNNSCAKHQDLFHAKEPFPVQSYRRIMLGSQVTAYKSDICNPPLARVLCAPFFIQSDLQVLQGHQLKVMEKMGNL